MPNIPMIRGAEAPLFFMVYKNCVISNNEKKFLKNIQNFY